MNRYDAFINCVMPREYEGEIFFVHKDASDTSHTFSLSDDVIFRLRLPRNAFVKSVAFELFDGYSDCKTHTFYARWKRSIDSFDEYELSFKSSILGVGLRFLSIIVDNGRRKLQISEIRGEKIIFKADIEKARKLQLTIYNFEHDVPTDTHGGIIYHIFVDRFNRGKMQSCKAGVRIVDDWSDGPPEYPEYPGAPLKNNTFFGGTLYGVADKLDYISSLGANIIYLSPIFEAASNHKYDTADYTRVDSMFGGDEALRFLLSECKKRNMYVILDGVFNHTGSDSVYFNRYGNYGNSGAYQSKESPFFNWYTFREYPDKYVCWWDIEILPRLDLENPDCAEYFVGDGGVVERYMKLGVSGFRLDVADELSDSFIKRIKEKMSELTDKNILFGEVWEDASNKIAYDTRKKYYLGNELDGVMNYPLRKGLLDFVLKNDVSALSYAFSEVFQNAPKRIADMQMNLLGTHDTERIITVLGAESSAGKRNCELKNLKMTPAQKCRAVSMLKGIYTVISTLPGIPSVFYGDEAGLEGYGDPFNRMPFPWGNENEELLSHYRKIGKIRRSNEVYKNGAFSVLHLSSNLLVFKRSLGAESLVTVFNNSTKKLNVDFDGLVDELILKARSDKFELGEFEGAIFRVKNKELSIKRI